jgi:hypothetical protein
MAWAASSGGRPVRIMNSSSEIRPELARSQANTALRSILGQSASGSPSPNTKEKTALCRGLRPARAWARRYRSSGPRKSSE